MLKGSPGFVNAAGFTVYVFDGDAPNQSACATIAGCSAVWPPVQPPAGSSSVRRTAALPTGWSIIHRPDGIAQLAYQGRALYTFIGDNAAGNVNGDNLLEFGAIWHIARPAASTPAPTTAPTSAPTASPMGPTATPQPTVPPATPGPTMTPFHY
ncbi:MAG TPA: hypothetical protein VKG44_01485 [Candidatus Baltobacteraceae bacterium]|nr:hypothetical protein [Candidatus Baltobacteraceae bacterium]